MFKLEALCPDSRTLKWRMVLSPKLNDLPRSVSLSVHCDKRKEKDRWLAQAAVVAFYDSGSRVCECSPVRSFVFSDGCAALLHMAVESLAMCYPVGGL